MIANCVPEAQAIWGMFAISISAFATGISVGLFISILIIKKKDNRG
jgi:hypothetical protein